MKLNKLLNLVNRTDKKPDLNLENFEFKSFGSIEKMTQNDKSTTLVNNIK